jgi:hypothetical protein
VLLEKADKIIKIPAQGLLADPQGARQPPGRLSGCTLRIESIGKEIVARDHEDSLR